MEKFVIGVALGIALGFSTAKHKLSLELEGGTIHWTKDIEYSVEKKSK